MDNKKTWLDKKVNDNTIRIGDIGDHVPIFRDYDPDNFDKYYRNGSSDMKFHNSEVENGYNQRFNNGANINIPPNTNRYHANYLFQQLVENEGNGSYNLGNEMVSLVTYDMKGAFYKFCEKYTTK